jgi:hypothetical protein
LPSASMIIKKKVFSGETAAPSATRPGPSSLESICQITHNTAYVSRSIQGNRRNTLRLSSGSHRLSVGISLGPFVWVVRDARHHNVRSRDRVPLPCLRLRSGLRFSFFGAEDWSLAHVCLCMRHWLSLHTGAAEHPAKLKTGRQDSSCTRLPPEFVGCHHAQPVRRGGSGCPTRTREDGVDLRRLSCGRVSSDHRPCLEQKPMVVPCRNVGNAVCHGLTL